MDVYDAMVNKPGVVPMGVGVGHPAPAEEKKSRRPAIPLDELVNWERWAP